MASDVQKQLVELRSFFGDPRLRTVAGGKPPRTLITEALVDTFCGILENLCPSLIVEIGAHEAAFSCKMRQLLPDVPVVAFEANPHVHARYVKNPKILQSGIRYVHCAVADKTATVELNIPILVAGTEKSLHNTMASLHKLSVPNSDYALETVPCTTLDDYLADIPGDQVALWIDVEGAVDKVLAGAATTMQRTVAVICEVESSALWQGQVRDTDILALFQEFGLVPVLCDCQRSFQSNVVFMRAALLDREEVQGAITIYRSEVERHLSTLGSV